MKQKRRIAILFSLIWILTLGATTDNKTAYYDFHFYLNGRWVDGDNGDIVIGYPAEEDTAGNGTVLAWVGGADKRWRLTPDSTETWQFYETAAVSGADSVLTSSRQMLMTGTAPEGFISDVRSIDDDVITGDKIADDTITPEKFVPAVSGRGLFDLTATDVDTLRADVVDADTLLLVGYAGQTTTAFSNLGPSAMADIAMDPGSDITGVDSIAASHGQIGTANISTLTTTGHTYLGSAGDSTYVDDDLHVKGNTILGGDEDDTIEVWGMFELYTVIDSLTSSATGMTIYYPGVTVGDCACAAGWHPASRYQAENNWGLAQMREYLAIPAATDSVYVQSANGNATNRPFWLRCWKIRN